MSVQTTQRGVGHHIGHPPKNSPEYPQRPAAHLNRPTAMRISGRTSHCETEPLVGHRNAARGKEGARTRTSDLEIWVPSPSPPALPLRRGLCWPLEGVPAIVAWSSRVDEIHTSKYCMATTRRDRLCDWGMGGWRGGGCRRRRERVDVGFPGFIRGISRSCPQPRSSSTAELVSP